MLNILKAVFKVGYKVVFSYFAWMRKYAKKPNDYPMKEKYAKLSALSNDVVKALKGNVTVVGKENIPSGTVCFLSNHLNASDPLIYLSIIDKPTTFVCKIEVEKMPFVSKCVKSIEGEFIDRQDLKSSLRTMMKVEASLKERNKNWLIFPEGTRNRDPRSLLLMFHQGTFRAPTKAEVPIVPCCLYGTQRLVSKRWNLKKVPIYLEFGKPLMPEEYKNMTTQEVANEIQSRVQTMLSYHARQVDKKALVEILGDKYNENY